MPDPFAEDVRPKSAVHEIGGDLSILSVHELDERVAILEREIARLKEARSAKESSRAAASAFFKLGGARSEAVGG